MGINIINEARPPWRWVYTWYCSKKCQNVKHCSSVVVMKTAVLCIWSVASARWSGQQDFQRGTPPVSLASCSISHFLIACIIMEWSTKDHETDSTGTSILIPLLLLNFNMRLYGNPTAWYLFWPQHPQKLFRRKTNELDNQTKPRRNRMRSHWSYILRR